MADLVRTTPPRLWPLAKQAADAGWTARIARLGPDRVELMLTPPGREIYTVRALWEVGSRGRWRLKAVRVRDGYGGHEMHANLRDIPGLIREEGRRGE